MFLNTFLPDIVEAFQPNNALGCIVKKYGSPMLFSSANVKFLTQEY